MRRRMMHDQKPTALAPCSATSRYRLKAPSPRAPGRPGLRPDRCSSPAWPQRGPATRPARWRPSSSCGFCPSLSARTTGPRTRRTRARAAPGPGRAPGPPRSVPAPGAGAAGTGARGASATRPSRPARRRGLMFRRRSEDTALRSKCGRTLGRAPARRRSASGTGRRCRGRGASGRGRHPPVRRRVRRVPVDADGDRLLAPAAPHRRAQGEQGPQRRQRQRLHVARQAAPRGAILAFFFYYDDNVMPQKNELGLFVLGT